MHAAIVCMEEVASVRDALCAGRLQTALGPSRRAQPSTVLSEFSDMVDRINDPILDTGWPGWNQPSAAGYFLLAHGSLDAGGRQMVLTICTQTYTPQLDFPT